MKDTRNSTSSSNFHGVGRRKAAVARVWLKKGNGSIHVNGKNYADYFNTDTTRDTVTNPFKIVGLEKNFDAKITVEGGGIVGQSEAVCLGIARALLVADESLKKTLRQASLLTVDARKKERKKYGQRGARRKFQFVKR